MGKRRDGNCASRWMGDAHRRHEGDGYSNGDGRPRQTSGSRYVSTAAATGAARRQLPRLFICWAKILVGCQNIVSAVMPRTASHLKLGEVLASAPGSCPAKWGRRRRRMNRRSGQFSIGVTSRSPIGQIVALALAYPCPGRKMDSTTWIGIFGSGSMRRSKRIAGWSQAGSVLINRGTRQPNLKSALFRSLL